MAANQQIGWSVEAKLLNRILKQLEMQTKVISGGIPYTTTTTTAAPTTTTTTTI